jgi:hypothetical protein
MIGGEILEGVRGVAVEAWGMTSNVTKYAIRTNHKQQMIRGAFPAKNGPKVKVRGFKTKLWCVLDDRYCHCCVLSATRWFVKPHPTPSTASTAPLLHDLCFRASIQTMLLNEVRPKIIYLGRRNLLKMAVSNIRASQLRTKCASSNVLEGSDCSLGPSHIDVAVLMDMLPEMVALYEPPTTPSH